MKKTKYKEVQIWKKGRQSWPCELGFVTPLGLHMGLQASTEWTYKIRRKEIKKGRVFLRLGIPVKDGVRRQSLSRVIVPSLIVYRQERLHTAVMPAVQGFYRRTCNRGFVYEWGMGLGHLRTWYMGDVYAVKADGSIKQKNLGTRGYMAGIGTFGLGWDMRNWKRLKNPGILTFRIQAALLTPFGANVGFMSYTSVGYRFQWKGFTRLLQGKEVKR
ncbi:MAG: hypothetical protein JNL57_13450 [Bacteroidetes bacterium]|nr:hypothetical protein [Bacteroidota bacterium]